MRNGLRSTFRQPVFLRAREEGRADGGLTGAALRVGAELGGEGVLQGRNDRIEVGENRQRSHQTGNWTDQI
jgi:hypothetical protein